MLPLLPRKLFGVSPVMLPLGEQIFFPVPGHAAPSLILAMDGTPFPLTFGQPLPAFPIAALASHVGHPRLSFCLD